MTSPLFPRQLDLLQLVKDHTFTLAYGSARGGKSYLFAWVIIIRALAYNESQHIVLRQVGNSIKTTIWITFLEVLRLFDGLRAKVTLNLSELTITFPNNSTIVFAGVQDEERIQKILGAEYATIFLNEIVDIPHATYEVITSRLNGNWYDDRGKRCELKLLADCNPKTTKHWVYQQWLEKRVPNTTRDLEDAHDYAWCRFDAESNPSVDENYYRRLKNQSAASQKRFVEGEWAEEVEGALFRSEDIENHRRPTPSTEDFDLTVVSVDPATTANETSDETGIIVMGVIDGHCYPIADLSGRYRPEEWGRIVVDAYNEYRCACVRIETNQGGDAMVHVIRSIDRTVNVKTFHAAAGQGKNMRAQPVAAEMAAGRIHLPTTPMAELESQLLAMTGDYDRKRGKSPDRLDAFVYAVSELVLAITTGPSDFCASKAVGFWR